MGEEPAFVGLASGRIDLAVLGDLRLVGAAGEGQGDTIACLVGGYPLLTGLEVLGVPGAPERGGGDGNESFLVIVIAATAADSAGGEGDGCQE